MIGYYDIVLSLVGSLLITGALAAALFGVGALIAVCGIAVAVVGHAMFIRPPTDIQKSAVGNYEVAD